MTRRIGFIFMASAVGLVLIVATFRASPLGVTLAAISILLLLLTFVMPELTLHIAVLSMLLSPEVALMHLGGVTGGHDTLTLRLEDFMLVFLGFSMLARIAIMKEFSDLQRSPLNGPIVAYFGTCVISTLAGSLKGYVTPAAGFFYVLKYFEYYFVYYMVFTTVHEERQVKRLVTTFFVMAFCVILYGLWQVPQGERISAPFEGKGSPEPNTLGGYLVLVTAIAMGLLAHARGYFKKMGWGVVLLLAMIALLYTLSRASWVAMVPVLLTLLALYKRHVPLLVAAFTAIAVFWLLVAPQSLKDRVQGRIDETFPTGGAEAFEVLGGVNVDSSTAGRIANFMSVLDELPKDPLLGRGVSGWGLADTHWARLLAETGIVGSVAFLWLIIALIRRAQQTRRWAAEHAPHWSGLLDGYMLGLAGILGHSLGTETFVLVRIMEPFWFVTGLVLILPFVPQQSEPASEPADSEPAHASEPIGPLPAHQRWSP